MGLLREHATAIVHASRARVLCAVSDALQGTSLPAGTVLPADGAQH